MNETPAKGGPYYAQLKEYLIQCTGLAYYRTRDDELTERIARRLRSLRVDGYRAYLEMLCTQPGGQAELDLLIAELTIGETYFFRNTDQFDALRTVILPEILVRNRDTKTLRIWSAGCANGAEAHSLSVLIRDDFADRAAGWDISIVGTDVNRRFLSQARLGLYENWALRGMCPAEKERLFRPDHGRWLIRERYRQGLAFQYHNLVKDVAPSMLNNLFAFDLILCRNVMIYFDQATVTALTARLMDCMTDGGWLLVGHADSDIEAFRRFETVTANEITVYRKSGASVSPAAAATVARQPAAGLAWLEPDVQVAGPAEWNSAPRTTAPFTARPAAPPPAPAIERVRELADAGAWAEAARCCSALLEGAPLDPLPHFYQALILGQTGRIAEAENALRRSLYLDRGFILGHYHLGLLLQRSRDSSGAARRCFENVRTLLNGVDENFSFAHGDGITAACLRQLTEMQLEVL